MRVALISMSGVRVRSEELAELGVSLPGFVQRGKVIASLPSLAALTLAAVTPPDVEVHYLDVDDVKAHGLRTGYDLVGLSTFTAMAYETYALADRYRAAGIPVVIGGLHATLMPEEAKEHADAVCIGEGEALWPKILEDARHGALKPFYREERPSTYDISRTPVPRYELLDVSRYNRLTVQTSRGCPLDCEFCAASRIYGRYRIKPVEQVMREIDAIEAVWRNPFIELADDNTFVNKDWAKHLLREMGERDIRWFTETDVSVADDPELLDLLAKSGCQQILIGFESIFSTSLDRLDRSNWKRKRMDDYKRAIDAIQSKGITVNGCFILGLDGDTPDCFERIRDFVLDSNLLESQVTVLTPFPNTRLYHRLKAEGRLLQDAYWDRCTLFDVNFVPKNMTGRQLEEGLVFLFKELYNERVCTRRKRHFMEIHKRLLAAG
ncbi:MAG TPA: radical SAM protein [Pantanalinema sp.]